MGCFGIKNPEFEFSKGFMNIRAYHKRDAAHISELFHDSVHAISDELYTSNEKEDWAPTPPDYEIWEKGLEKKRPFVEK